ncbi:MAG TPA: phosphotransferase [Stellaceae bacterium]|nr:phosphotransferase [Stellaceae bacterium]
MKGGIEAAHVALATVRYRDAAGRQRVLRYVRKQLSGRGLREAAVHQQLAATYAARMSPRFFAIEPHSPGVAVLCIEAIRRTRSWPWRDPPIRGLVLQRIAELHAGVQGAAVALPPWDYDSEVKLSAEATLVAVACCRTDPDLAVLGKHVAPLRRIVLALPRLRRELLSERPFASVPIHGDLHTGNVLLRRSGPDEEPVLLDWGRTRIGSPFEDVSSWLQSLGYWEPEARRFHDTLLATYLSAFGMEQRLTSQIRAAHWVAGASNALAGALLYHLSVAADRHRSKARRCSAMHAANDWLRVIRRADAWCS